MGLTVQYNFTTATNRFSDATSGALGFGTLPDRVNLSSIDKNSVDQTSFFMSMGLGGAAKPFGYIKVSVDSAPTANFKLYQVTSASPATVGGSCWQFSVALVLAAGSFSGGAAVTFEFIPTYENTPDVQVFYGNGTWTKPAGARSVRAYLIGGGGGGGGGARYASGVRGGGGGGGGGAFCFSGSTTASIFGATENIVVGTPGTPGDRAATSSSNGTAGGAGGNTTMSYSSGTLNFLTANGGAGGGYGDNSGGGGGGTGGANTGNGSPGANGGNGGGATNGSGGGAGGDAMSGAGGGGGWGLNGSTNMSGGYGGTSGGFGGAWGAFNDGAGAGFDGSAGTNFGLPDGTPKSFGGGGGGGGTNSIATSGLAVHNGGRGNVYGGGGGGGGACTNGADGYNGGQYGAYGIAIIVTTF